MSMLFVSMRVISTIMYQSNALLSWSVAAAKRAPFAAAVMLASTGWRNFQECSADGCSRSSFDEFSLTVHCILAWIDNSCARLVGYGQISAEQGISEGPESFTAIVRGRTRLKLVA